MRSVLPPGLTPPRQATPRNFDRRTWGGHAAAIAKARGKPALPWQAYMYDVGLEVDDDGQFVYSIVLGTIQRQAGKTDADQTLQLQNATMGPRRRVWYTAQSGQHAGDRWLELVSEWDDSGSWLRSMAHKPRKSNGSQALTLLNGSTIRPHPPTPDSLHSKQSDRNTVDEAWFFSDQQGQQLLQAITPTTATRKMVTGIRPQLWIFSTEGTVDSTWLNGLLARARAGDPTICLFDWGIGPDVDPTDLDAVAAAHPGYGHLLDRSTLADALAQLGPGEFARAYGNRRTGATERVIPHEPWAAARFDHPFPDGRIALGAAVGLDGVDTTITAGVRHGDEVIVAVVDHRPGTSWAINSLVELAREHKAPVAIDTVGPSAALHDQAEKAGLEMIDLGTTAVSAACANVLSWITDREADKLTPKWRYRPHPAFDDAAELATRRWVNDGAWLWGRRLSVGSISALEAATVTTWAVDHLPPVRVLQLA